MSISDLYTIFKQYPLISTDTRNIEQDSLYFALKGSNFNGNDFALQALESGAKYAIVDEEIARNNPNIIQVDDVLSSLQELAQYHRNQFDIPVLGITGTNGKTTSKELILAVLSEKYNTLATVGNFNNHIGVPLTLLKITNEHEFAIIEMGANHPGEIADLCQISNPTFGLVTNVGHAHLEGFGTYKNIITTKSALYQHVKNNSGVNFFLDENKEIRNYLGESYQFIYYSCQNKLINNFGFGDDKSLFLKLYIEKLDALKTSPFEIQTNLIGLYNQSNIMAAVTIGAYFKIPESNIKDALESYQPSNNRSQLKETSRNQVIMDAYNANPSSVSEAVHNFEKLENTNKILILGDMFELGEYTSAKHQEIADHLLKVKDLNIILVGKAFFKSTIGSSKHIQQFLSTEDLLNSNRLKSIDNALVLLKGSRGMSLERLVDFL